MSAHDVVLAPAKINLTLGVLERRADGFHELDTTMLALDWCDRLWIDSQARAPRVRVLGPQASPDIPTDARNLCARAADAVAALVGRTAPKLVLEKHIPSQAGLGGGSSDAAAAVWLVARHFDIDPDDERVRTALAALGSDCSFFLEARASGMARCTGRGEHIEPLIPGNGIRESWVAVLTPDVACATPTVFHALRPEEWNGAKPWIAGQTQVLREAMGNDLERAAERVEPTLSVWREVFSAEGAGHWRLSGSGSSCFGLYESRASAETALARLAAAGKARNLGLRGQCVTRARGRGIGPENELEPSDV